MPGTTKKNHQTERLQAIRLRYSINTHLEDCGITMQAWPCCMDHWEGRTHPYPVLGSCDADGLRTSQLQHAVQRMDGNLHLGRPALVRAAAQPITDGSVGKVDTAGEMRRTGVAGR